MATAQDLLDDILDALRAGGVDLMPWAEVGEGSLHDRPNLLAIAYPAIPASGLPAQVTFRPVADTKLAIVVAQEVKHRLERFASGDPTAVISLDTVNDRPVALIYDLR